MNQISLLIALIVYRLAYDLCYVNIFPSHEYNGIELDISTFNYIVSLVSIAIIPFTISFKSRILPSKIFIMTYIFLFLIPLSSYFALANQSLVFYLWCVFFLILLGSLTQKALIISSSPGIVLVLTRFIPIILIVVSFLVVLFANGVPSLTALNFMNVYTVRSEFNSSIFIEYISSASIYFALPIMLSMAILNKKYLLSVFLWQLVGVC